jgi:hypothetical protein
MAYVMHPLLIRIVAVDGVVGAAVAGEDLWRLHPLGQ